MPEHQRVTVQVPSLKEPVREEEPWTEEKNARRCDLIDREIEGTLTHAEAAELEELQRQAIAHRVKVAPLPMKAARELHEESLKKKRAAQG